MRLDSLLAVFVAGACGLQEADTIVGFDTGEATVDCPSVARNPCESFEGCTAIFARPLRQTPQGLCYDNDIPLEEVGCRNTVEDCGFALTFATGPLGELWWFPNECLPVGYTRFIEVNPGDC